MLIAAIPKSASTSLMSTLGSLHGLPASQSFFDDEFARRPAPPEYSRLANYHFDIRQLDRALAEGVSKPGIVAKHHVPPSTMNLELLGEHRVVVLLRDPSEVVLAYRRGIRNRVHDPMNGFRDCDSQADWLRRARENGLLDDLERFREGWLSHEGPALVVRYDELVEDPTGVVRRIESFWTLPQTTGDVRLAKERYSRRGPLARWFRGFDEQAGAAAVQALSSAVGRESRLYRALRRTYGTLRRLILG